MVFDAMPTDELCNIAWMANNDIVYPTLVYPIS